MKSVELLLTDAILSDIGIVLHTSIDRDSKYIESRFEHEGWSFLAITLPTFAKDFERSLEQGYVSPDLFRSFSKLRERPLIPKFLSGITAHVFDDSGIVRTDASIMAIDGIRQVCLAFNKPKMECSDDRKAKAIQSYIQCERDLRSIRPLSWIHYRDFIRVSNMLFGNLCSDIEHKLDEHLLKPKHGPGAVADRITGNSKYCSRKWSRRIDRYFPFDRYGVPSWNDPSLLEGSRGDHVSNRTGTVRSKDKTVLDDTVRVIFVPKTLKSPRVIAIEPIHHQFVQQALMKELVEQIENDRTLRFGIHFTSSERNRNLARESSRHRKYATLDMSEASDRVHAGLAYSMFRFYPKLARSIFSCRTKYAQLPNGVKIPLVKFSSMGSALCFPIESMFHYTLSIIGILRARSLPLTFKSILKIKRELCVFGDDLVIPIDAVSSVIEVLESAGCKVNQKKSFSTGFFRESCGVDAYKGHIVTPVYLRRQAPRHRRDVSEIVSYVASANLFYKKGYWKTAQFMRLFLESLIGTLPHVEDTSQLLGWTSVLRSKTIGRWNKILHRFETFGFIPKIQNRPDKIDGYDRLFKFFLNRTEYPTEQGSYERSAIRDTLVLRPRWRTPH